ncbi:hypothetical protein NQ314_017247 [Rhamnusium bicolor]|uniref:Retrotransposon gag domain-containing protein n=1 Tax=Rhamnusium bicolor TaxID=1586634 RepID=A0AAV8WTU8_9CUCU|nr:hypothetical protein NQ314_017247 [Rhamnusium bicolor]
MTMLQERLEQFFLANRIENERKVSVLLTSIDETYKTLKNLCDPAKPKDKSYEQLIGLLSTQFKARVSVYRRRIQFDSLRQGAETVNQWFVKVKNAAARLFSGEMLVERVKDKFVVGMRPGPILDRLCEEETTKSVRDLLEIALNKEAVERQVEAWKLTRFIRKTSLQLRKREKVKKLSVIIVIRVIMTLASVGTRNLFVINVRKKGT